MDATQAKDKVCKRLFRHRRLVEDLLRAHIPGRWVRQVDFGTLRLMPTEFVGRAGDRRLGDVLWVAGLRDGRQVMVMIEIQSDVDRDMAARMAAYTGMVYDSLTPDVRGAKHRYPAIFPLVVYTGNADWTAADNLRDVADPVPGLAVYIAGRRYTRLDLNRRPHDDVFNNRLSVLAHLTGGRSVSDMVPVLSKMAGWLRRDGGDAEDRKLFAAYQDWVKVLLPQLGHPGSGTGHGRALGLERTDGRIDGIGSAVARMAAGVVGTGPGARSGTRPGGRPGGRPARLAESPGLASVRRGDSGSLGRRLDGRRSCAPRDGRRPRPGLRNRSRVAQPRQREARPVGAGLVPGLVPARAVRFSVEDLLPQLGVPFPEPDTDAVLDWRELMDGLTVLEARSREWPQEWLEQGRKEGQLALLSRQVSRRFGAATAEALVAALTSGDHVRLETVADLVLDCETGPGLLNRVNGKPGP